jgi:hypothetical protein
MKKTNKTILNREIIIYGGKNVAEIYTPNKNTDAKNRIFLMYTIIPMANLTDKDERKSIEGYTFFKSNKSKKCYILQ